MAQSQETLERNAIIERYASLPTEEWIDMLSKTWSPFWDLVFVGGDKDLPRDTARARDAKRAKHVG